MLYNCSIVEWNNFNFNIPYGWIKLQPRMFRSLSRFMLFVSGWASFPSFLAVYSWLAQKCLVACKLKHSEQWTKEKFPQNIYKQSPKHLKASEFISIMDECQVEIAWKAMWVSGLMGNPGALNYACLSHDIDYINLG